MLELKDIEIDVIKWIKDNDVFNKNFEEVEKALGNNVDLKGEDWIHSTLFAWAESVLTADFDFNPSRDFLESIRLSPIFEHYSIDGEVFKTEVKEKEEHFKNFFESIGMEPFSDSKMLWTIDDYVFKIVPFGSQPGFVVEIQLKLREKIEQHQTKAKKFSLFGD